MNNRQRADYLLEARKIATSLRLRYVTSYIARGMFEQAADQLRFIDREDAQDPAVLAATAELEKARKG